MTQDDMEQVKYKCSVCSRSHQIDDTSLARIIEDFKDLGWANVEDATQDKTVFTVYCPKCWEKEQDGHVPDWQMWLDELDEQDLERQSLTH